MIATARRARALPAAFAVELLFWVVAAAGGAFALRTLRERTSAAPSPAAEWTLSEPVVVANDSLAAAAELVVERDPFRLSRRPASADFQISPPVGQPMYMPPPPVVRPMLVLKGIVGGPPWQAYIDGIPGREGGLLVARGDTVAIPSDVLRIRAVGRDTVVVQGADTTWRLTVKRTW